ncbi:hypothetical protein PJN38_24210 [Mycobacterium kansasii]
MAQPATGAPYRTSVMSYQDALRSRRGGDWQVLVRDYDGANTNISPGSAFAAPMAQDGTWRNDLFAAIRVSGKWVYNNAVPDNLGFFPVGYVHPDGIERAPKLSSDPLEALQSVDPLRYDLQKRERTLMFTPFENTEIVHCLEHDLPLSNPFDRGSGTYSRNRSNDSAQPRRQFIVCLEDRQGGKAERIAYPFPRCVLTDVGSRKGNKKDADAPKLTFSSEIDPWFVDAAGFPLIDGAWVAGDLWDDSGCGLTFTQVAPVAAATAATTADVVFAQPLGGASPFGYTVEKSPNGTSSWTSATVGTTNVASGVVTLGLTGLTTATTYYFRVTVTDDNSDTALSRVSNQITTQ